MAVKPHHLRCLRFVAEHPGGTRRNAFMGYRYDFTAPELKRAPFRKQTLAALFHDGYLTTKPLDGFRERIEITAKGRKALEAAS